MPSFPSRPCVRLLQNTKVEYKAVRVHLCPHLCAARQAIVECEGLDVGWRVGHPVVAVELLTSLLGGRRRGRAASRARWRSPSSASRRPTRAGCLKGMGSSSWLPSSRTPFRAPCSSQGSVGACPKALPLPQASLQLLATPPWVLLAVPCQVTVCTSMARQSAAACPSLLGCSSHLSAFGN